MTSVTWRGDVGSWVRESRGTAVVNEGLRADERITAVGLFFEAHAAVRRALEQGIAEAGDISPQWFEVLLRLSRTPGNALRMTELANAMTSISPSGLTRLVDRLEDAGYVHRRRCADDRRGAFAEVTAEGIALVERILPRHLADIDAAFVGLLGERELASVSKAMRKLRDTAAAPGTDQ